MNHTKILDVIRYTPGAQELYTVTPDTGAASALRMSNAPGGPKYMLVLDGNVLAGIVSRGDLSRARPLALCRDVMRTPVLCVAGTTTVEEVAQIFSEQNVSFLPVVHDGNIVGAATPEMVGQPKMQPALPEHIFVQSQGKGHWDN